MKTIYCVFFTVFLMTGCAYRISDIDTSGLDPECVRECSKAYSECVSGQQVGFKTETLRACRDGYQACVQTCPEKKTVDTE